MAVIATFEKQPADILDYDIDYSQWLPDNDSVSSVSVTITPNTGLVVDTAIVIDEGKRVKLWVEGGNNNTTYKVEVTATTVLSRVKQDEIRFRCKEY